MDFAFAPPFGGLAYRDSIARLFAAETLFLLRNTQKPKKSPRAAGAKKAAVPVDGGRLPENERANGNAIS